MVWESRKKGGGGTEGGEDEGVFVIIGDPDKEPKHHREAVGLLVKVGIGRKYKKQKEYHLLTPENTRVRVGGSFAIDEQLNELDIGQIVKIVFLGMRKSASTGNDVKDIEVAVWDGKDGRAGLEKKYPELIKAYDALAGTRTDLVAERTEWERIEAEKKGEPTPAAPPPAEEDEDDDLPF